MHKLDRKLIRDLSHTKGQVIAITAVIAAGVATFVMSMCAYASLVSSKNYFYSEFRFADVFSGARRVPNSIEPRIKELSGVSAVETRLVFDVLINVPTMSEPATGRLISVPERGENRLNQLYLRRGRMVTPGRAGEVVVSEKFAEVHNFVAGDTVSAIINGRRQTLTIVGVALSPEYVMQIQPGSIFPDDRRFGVFWINERDLEAAFDMTGAFNSVSLKLARAANVVEVIDHLDSLLEPFGSIGAFDREDQLSHRYLMDEMNGLRGMAIVAPIIFLSVAAFLLNIVISRIISQQREQIAALKAFGYTNYEVGFHYLNLVLIISLSGTMIGTLAGFVLANGMTGIYQEFYKFPVLEFQVDVFSVVMSFLLTTGAAVFGTWFSVRNAIRLPPAEAMRPEPPPSFQPTMIEKLIPSNWLPTELRMVVRNVARKPIKASLAVIGISMAVAIMLLGNFSIDSLDYMMEFQFKKAQRQDLTVSFVEPATASVIYEISDLPGVLSSETMRAVATRVKFKHHSQRVGIMGLDENPQLYRLLDTQEKMIEIPPFGLMLNSALAKKLHVGLGDEVTVEVLEGIRPTVTVKVSAIVEEYAGLNAYMNKQQLHALLKESSVASGAFLNVDTNRMDDVFNELERRPGVASVAIKDAMMKSFQKTVADNILIMRSFIVIFAAIIAMGVVYNTARISLSEQSRDLATMRVIGFTQREVSTVLLGEIILFTALAIPVGWAIGYAFAGVMVAGLATDNYRLPLVVSRNTFTLAAMVVVVSTLISAIIVQRRISQLDLIGVLKTRE